MISVRYLCSWCGKTFTESCKLKRHLSKLHHDKVKEAQENAGVAGSDVNAAATDAKKVSKKKKNLETIIENKFPTAEKT